MDVEKERPKTRENGMGVVVAMTVVFHSQQIKDERVFDKICIWRQL